MAGKPYQAPASRASAMYIDLDEQLSNRSECEDVAGALKVVYREFDGGRLVGSTTARTAGALTTHDYDRCHLEIEALFPNDLVWTFTVTVPYPSNIYSPADVCEAL